jgi:predicted Holliday junction resolvase-like endonuclease
MMGWAIAILFGTAVVLLILSFIKTTQSNSQLEQQIEHVSISVLNEVHELEKQLRNIQLDAEITAQQSGAAPAESEERFMLREMLDLHKRGYSIESIASKKQLTPNEVERMLAPYMTRKTERSLVAQ